MSVYLDKQLAREHINVILLPHKITSEPTRHGAQHVTAPHRRHVRTLLGSVTSPQRRFTPTGARAEPQRHPSCGEEPLPPPGTGGSVLTLGFLTAPSCGGRRDEHALPVTGESPPVTANELLGARSGTARAPVGAQRAPLRAPSAAKEPPPPPRRLSHAINDLPAPLNTAAAKPTPRAPTSPRGAGTRPSRCRRCAGRSTEPSLARAPLRTRTARDPRHGTWAEPDVRPGAGAGPEVTRRAAVGAGGSAAPGGIR